MKVLHLGMAFALICSAIAATEWSYTGSTGPESWKTNFPDCGKSSQSPVDIVTSTVQLDESLGKFDRDTFKAKPATLVISNNGHAVVVTVTDGYTISDRSVLPNDYKLAQYHLHWASSATTAGSEHTVNGNQYFGELHGVFFNTQYADLSTAATQTGGLAVLGFFISSTYPQDNLDFNRIFFDNLASIDNKDETLTLSASNLAGFETLLPPDISEYYRYNGSLTTPSCSESVIWTVFKEPIEISTAQATTLTTALKVGDASSATLVNNFRPVQSLNGRIIKTNSGAIHVSPMSLGIALVVASVSTIIAK